MFRAGERTPASRRRWRWTAAGLSSRVSCVVASEKRGRPQGEKKKGTVTWAVCEAQRWGRRTVTWAMREAQRWGRQAARVGGAGRQPGSAGPAGDLGGARKRAVQGTARTGQGAKPPGAPYLPTGPLSRGAATALAVPGRSACWSPRTHACHAQGQARRGRLAHSREANASAEDARGTGTRRGSSSPSGFKKKIII